LEELFFIKPFLGFVMSTNETTVCAGKDNCCILAARMKFFLELHKYNVDHMGQYYEHRAKLTSIALAIYGILLGAIFNFNLALLTIVFAVALIAVSRFFERFMLKLYERSQYHRSRAAKLRDQIDSEFCKIDKDFTTLDEIYAIADEEHKGSKPPLGTQVMWGGLMSKNMHVQWAYLHRGFFVVGIMILSLIFIVNIFRNAQFIYRLVELSSSHV
jgi:hypothetical protein